MLNHCCPPPPLTISISPLPSNTKEYQKCQEHQKPEGPWKLREHQRLERPQHLKKLKYSKVMVKNNP